MLKELEQRPKSGFQDDVKSLGSITQYRRSFDHLEAYSRSKDLAHWPAWMAFNTPRRAHAGGCRHVVRAARNDEASAKPSRAHAPNDDRCRPTRGTHCGFGGWGRSPLHARRTRWDRLR